MRSTTPRARIRAGLAASDPALGPYAPLPLAVLLHETERGGAGGDAGALVGGLIGETVWGWLSIRLLWVDPAHRGAGHGRRLLAAAEAEGGRRGCGTAASAPSAFRPRGSTSAAAGARSWPSTIFRAATGGCSMSKP
jgi:GNAT superfamily N-acetyltransferase